MALAAIFTSAFAGAAGLGGGLMLLSMLPAFLPASALIPLHAVSQWFSNASRLGMKYREVDTSLIKPLFIGAIAGALVGALLYRSFRLKSCRLFWASGFYGSRGAQNRASVFPSDSPLPFWGFTKAP
jgi:uncharacterized membrane protein YfcA